MRFHRVLLVVNPVARTVSKPTLAVIEKALSADFALEVAETKEKGHASELAAQAVHDGIDLVVVFSGDGTINEAVNALAGTEVALAAEHGERFAQIAAVSSFVVNGDRASRDTVIADGDEVAILPPVSGG